MSGGNQSYYPGGQQRQSGGYHQGGYQYQGGYSGGNAGGMRGGAMRGRAPRRPVQARGRGVYNQGNRQQRQQDQQIFAKEFDFEQANEEFEELRTQLAKTKISGENGESNNAGGAASAFSSDVDDRKEDSGHETATTGDGSDESSSSMCYDKTKSFFDSISCEALERSKG